MGLLFLLGEPICMVQSKYEFIHGRFNISPLDDERFPTFGIIVFRLKRYPLDTNPDRNVR